MREVFMAKLNLITAAWSLAIVGAMAVVARAVPPPPTDLVLTVRDDGFEVSWTPVPGSTGYLLQRWVDNEPDFDKHLKAGETQFVDDRGFVAGKIYAYRVAAKDASGLSKFSPQKSSPVRSGGTAFKITSPQNGKEISSVGTNIAWTKAPGATDGYQLTVKRMPKGTVVTTQPFTKEQTSSTLPPYVNLVPGTSYSFDIVGKQKGTTDFKATNSPVVVPVRSVLSDLHKVTGLTLQRAYGPDGKQAATFSLLDASGADAEYRADFALMWDPRVVFRKNDNADTDELEENGTRLPPRDRPWVTPRVSLEGHLAPNDNKDKKSQDALRFRLGAEIDQTIEEEKWGYYVSLMAKYETDSDWDTEVASFEAMFSPSVPALAIGSDKSLTEIWSNVTGRKMSAEQRERESLMETRTGPFFRWRPFVGVDVGKMTDRPRPKPGQPEPNDEVLRLLARLRAELNFPHGLSLHKVQLYADETYFWLPLDDEPKHHHNFFTMGVDFYFNPNFSVGFTYKAGADAPDFDVIHAYGFALGLKF
jgi:hypothetical protein